MRAPFDIGEVPPPARFRPPGLTHAAKIHQTLLEPATPFRFNTTYPDEPMREPKRAKGNSIRGARPTTIFVGPHETHSHAMA